MSSLKQLYHQWEDQLKSLYEWQRPEHRKVLAWLMVGIFVAKDVCLERLGIALPQEAKPESVGQQFRRWLKNPKIDERMIYDPVARQVLESMRCRRFRIQLDRVQIKTRQNVLMLSIWYRNRAIPLAWHCLAHRGNSHIGHWRELLDYLASILPLDAQVIILADREFGSVARMDYVVKKDWNYAIRLKGDQVLYDAQWGQPVQWIPLDFFMPKVAESFVLEQMLLTKGEVFATHIACAWRADAKEAWFIATNLAKPIVALKEYARRFGCEELFSDLKKRGFNWEDSRLHEPQRLSRLLLALALLTVFLLQLGRKLKLSRLDLEITSPCHRSRLSLFQTARRWLRRRLSRNKLPAFLPYIAFGYFI